MFVLEPYDQKATCAELVLDEALFHRALADGGSRYHVRNPKGADFDIRYLDNNDLEPRDIMPSFVKPPYIATYRTYDETDRQTMYLDFFDGLKCMEFEELNEYTIALTKAVLWYTDMEVVCTDPRIQWFVPANERLRVCDELPEPSAETTLYVQRQYLTGLEGGGYNRLSSVYAFHNVFFFQWLLDGRKLSQFRYGTLDLGEIGGIGAILSNSNRFKMMFKRFGLKLICRDERIGKFRTKLLDDYFSLDLIASDATDENTLVAPYRFPLIKTKCVYGNNRATDTSILSDGFKGEMDEYYDTLFGDKKMLGILIRGTDYISSGMSGARLMATVPQMVPTIRQWMEEDGYDQIFLATEDEDILNQMWDEFGNTVVVVAQERHSVSEFKPGQIINDFEKEMFSAEEYDERVEDATINYFYALYMLSRCDSFMCSGQCNGWDIVNSFNGGRFRRCYKFQVGVA